MGHEIHKSTKNGMFRVYSNGVGAYITGEITLEQLTLRNFLKPLEKALSKLLDANEYELEKLLFDKDLERDAQLMDDWYDLNKDDDEEVSEEDKIQTNVEIISHEAYFSDEEIKKEQDLLRFLADNWPQVRKYHMPTPEPKREES